MAGRLPPPAEGPLWFPHKARVGQGGQSAAAALHALGLPPLQARPALAELFAAHTLDGFAEREAGPPAPPARLQPARHARGTGAGPVLAARAWEGPKGRAAGPPADRGPTRQPAERAEGEAGAASAAAPGGGTHAAAACGDVGAGDGAPGARAAAAGGARAAPRGPAALQRYNGLSAAEADALEHVFTGEGVRPWLRPCNNAHEPLALRTASLVLPMRRLLAVSSDTRMLSWAAMQSPTPAVCCAADAVAFYARFGPDSAVRFFCCVRRAARP